MVCRFIETARPSLSSRTSRAACCGRCATTIVRRAISSSTTRAARKTSIGRRSPIPFVATPGRTSTGPRARCRSRRARLATRLARDVFDHHTPRRSALDLAIVRRQPRVVGVEAIRHVALGVARQSVERKSASDRGLLDLRCDRRSMRAADGRALRPARTRARSALGLLRECMGPTLGDFCKQHVLRRNDIDRVARGMEIRRARLALLRARCRPRDRRLHDRRRRSRLEHRAHRESRARRPRLAARRSRTERSRSGRARMLARGDPECDLARPRKSVDPRPRRARNRCVARPPERTLA